MRVRLRGPGGVATATLAHDSTIGDLIDQISEKCAVTAFDIKYGFPPKPLLLDEDQRPNLLTSLAVKLDGESLTIVPKDDVSASASATEKQTSPAISPQKAKELAGSVSFSGMSPGETKQKPQQPIPLKKKTMSGEVPELPLPEYGATLGESSNMLP